MTKYTKHTYLDILPEDLQCKIFKDVKIQELEEKIEELQKEIHSLRRDPMFIFFSKNEIEEQINKQLSNDELEHISDEFDTHCQYFLEFYSRF